MSDSMIESSAQRLFSENVDKALLWGGAALFLGEKVHWRRWAAVGIGFAGMVVIGLFGLLIAVGLNWLERLLLPWARDSK